MDKVAPAAGLDGFALFWVFGRAALCSAPRARGEGYVKAPTRDFGCTNTHTVPGEDTHFFDVGCWGVKQKFLPEGDPAQDLCHSVRSS
jgi:hypothetical protein